jgi:hypothetical protein
LGRWEAFDQQALDIRQSCPGRPPPDSDLDIAIELDMSAAQGSDESGGLATWMLDTEGWLEELQKLSGLLVDLHQLDGADSPTIQSALERSSLLVYEKRRNV